MKAYKTILRLRRPGVICLALSVLLIAGDLDPTAVHAQQATGLEFDTDRLGQDYKGFALENPNPELCRSACTQDPQCQAFTYVKPGFKGPAAHCYLKSGTPAPVADACCISGVKSAASAHPPPVLQYPGSYNQSCLNVTVSGTTLVAKCKNFGGTYVNTTLERIDLCRGDIRNHGGYLTCDKAGLPAGSYLKTCININVSGKTIHAVCASRRKGFLGARGRKAVRSILSDYDLCLGDIRNIDGFLDCRKSNVPVGSYLDTCINVNVIRNELQAACRDRAGSLKVTILEELGRCVGDISNRDGFLTCPEASPAKQIQQQATPR